MRLFFNMAVAAKKKGFTSAQKDALTKKLLATIRNPLATKKEKHIMASKWRFNQLPQEYRATNIKKYLAEFAKMEAQPESDFEHLTKF